MIEKWQPAASWVISIIILALIVSFLGCTSNVTMEEFETGSEVAPSTWESWRHVEDVAEEGD